MGDLVTQQLRCGVGGKWNGESPTGGRGWGGDVRGEAIREGAGGGEERAHKGEGGRE